MFKKTSMINSIVFICVFLMPILSNAAINFTNGAWSTTFNYSACTQRGGGGATDCATVQTDGIYWSWGAKSVDGHYTEVTPDANNPVGSGGNGFRQWKGSGADNLDTGSARIDFPAPQKELWIRWYERYQKGFQWLGPNGIGVKSLYFRTNVATPGSLYVGYNSSNDYRIYNQGGWTSTGTGYPLSKTGGWNTVYPGGTSDGTWHCFEIYLKMDTDTTNGIGTIWEDGVLLAHQTNVNWSGGDATALLGWTWFEFLSNQKDPALGSAYYADLDDMAIYNIKPPNTDAQGNPFIGPIAGGVVSSTPKLSVNGVCGSASGQSFTSLTSSSPNLCSTGTVASFSGTGPWKWGCSGSDGGTSTSSTACSALLATTTSTPPATITSTMLFSESFEDYSYAVRGWYDNTNHGTIASGGQSGNCLQWAWAGGSTTPTNGGSIRMKFTPTDSLYVSYYVKFQTGWRGSGANYHPHLIYILSDLDSAASAYSPLANNYLDTYLEFLADTTSPFAIRPQIAIQDQKRVNTSYGTPPNNLSATTENRSVAYCNTPVSASTMGTCYADAPYYSANTWKASTASLSTNAWHKVEVYLKMNSISGGKGISDGIMQEWIDGTLVINQNDVLYRTNQDATKKWAQFVFAPYMSPPGGSPISQTMWIDELKVMTAPPISSSLTPPAGLTIKSITP